MKKVFSWFKSKLITPLLNYLKQGMSPHKLALAVALGVSFGLFPIFGITTALCALAALVTKTNLAAVQLINYMLYPIQLVLMVLLIQLGAWIAGAEVIPYSIDEMASMIGDDWQEAFRLLWKALLLAIMAWALTVVPLSLLIYWLSKNLFCRIIEKKGLSTVEV